MRRTAVLIANYNMPERADALARKVLDFAAPLDLILVDNGSDIAQPAEHTTLQLKTNVQTTGAWLTGLAYADQLAVTRGEPYGYYWFLITSADFPNEQDVLTPMVEWMDAHENAVGIHPALTPDSTTSWEHLKARGGSEPRPTWMIDNIASLYCAEWFDGHRFDKRMRYAWGIDLETCYHARIEQRGLYVDERVSVRKVTDIGYKMQRMNMTADDRRKKAGDNMRDIMSMKYGADWWYLVTNAGVTDDMR